MRWPLLLTALMAPPAAAGPLSLATRPAITQGAYAHDTDVDAYLAAIPEAPTRLQAKRLGAMVSCLKAGGVWKTRVGGLFLFAGWSQSAALTDLMRPAHVATGVGGPFFLVNRYVSGDGVASYVDLNDVYGSATSLCLQNSCSIGAWNLTSATTEVPIGQSSGTMAYTYITTTTTGRGGRLNNASTANYTVASAATAHVTLSRTGSAGFRTYDAGVSLGDMTSASLANAVEIATHRRTTTTYYTGRVLSVYYGAGLADADVAVLDTCMRPYLTSIGAAQ